MKLPILLTILIAAFGCHAQWSHYGADARGSRYSPMRQINRETVANLEVARTYHTGALEP